MAVQTGGVETRQLEYFVAVAEELSFTRAAQRTYAAQSTVSAAIRTLEHDLGVSLFERSSRSVELSASGAAFLPEAKAAIEAVEQARAAVTDPNAGIRGNLRVGTMTNVGIVDLPTILGAFHRRHPDVDVHLSVSPTGSTGLAADLRAGRLDVALLGAPESALEGLDARPLATASYVVLLPTSHPLARRRSVRLEDLAGERFVDGLTGFGNRISSDRAFEAQGVRRRVVVEVSDLTTIPSHVAEGLGVALVPDIVPADPGVVARPLSGTTLTWTLWVATRAGRRPSRAVVALLDLIA
jgi:DNA-binding transcriptional LysR family regulator